MGKWWCDGRTVALGSLLIILIHDPVLSWLSTLVPPAAAILSLLSCITEMCVWYVWSPTPSQMCLCWECDTHTHWQVCAGLVLCHGRGDAEVARRMGSHHCYLRRGASGHNCWSGPQGSIRDSPPLWRSRRSHFFDKSCASMVWIWMISHRCIIDASDSWSFCSQMPSGYGDVTVQNGSKIFMSLYVLTGTVLVANILNGWLERLILWSSSSM